MTRAKLSGQRCALVASTAILLFGTLGCQYLKWTRHQSVLRAKYKKDPSLLLEKELAPQNCFGFYGRFTLPPGGPKSVLVVALDHSSTSREVVGSREATSDATITGSCFPRAHTTS